MSSIVVELPHEAWIGAECAWRSKVGSVVGAPEAASTTEGGKARGSGEAGTEDGQDALGVLEVSCEG